MKNLYKIEDELYIISNTENISENCWIITEGRLVQVSYLLSNEVAKGNKVILTTNKLLIKDGVQAIDDEFLEWFVKNPSCEVVEVKNVYKTFLEGDKRRVSNFRNRYKIIIPKEEAKQDLEKEMFELEQELNIPSNLRWHNSKPKPKQETLEEAAQKRFPINHNLSILERMGLNSAANMGFIEGAKWQQEQEKITTDDAYNEGFENGKHSQQERSYSEEEVLKIIQECKSYLSFGDEFDEIEWFNKFKKK